MCVVSMVGDHYNDKWKDWQPQSWPYPTTRPIQPVISPNTNITWPQGVSQVEFDKLKSEVLEMKKLLERALEYDKKNNEPHCEMEDKVKLLKQVAALVGVSLEDIFKNE